MGEIIRDPHENKNQPVYLLMLSGLPGVGKSTVAVNLGKHIMGFVVINQNDIRRRFGYKKMPKSFDRVLREIDRLIADNLRSGRSVIFDSVNRRMVRRHQLYGIASCCNAKVVVLEVVCPPSVAKQRMAARPGSDGLLSDPNDPAVYDKLKLDSDPVTSDFVHPGQDHVSYIQFDSHKNELIRKIVVRGTGTFISRLEKILVAQNA